MPNLKINKHNYTATHYDALVTKESVENNAIGLGDDVFMVGRFVDHDGGRVNIPSARFGNISVNLTDIKQPNGRIAKAYCLDMHSRSGYSGSPVFVYRLPGYDLEQENEKNNPRVLFAGNNYLGLLGIHFASFPEEWQIVDSTEKTNAESKAEYLGESKSIKGLSGMTCILPAWNIAELLNSPKLKAQRDVQEAALQAKWGFPPTPIAEGSTS